MKVMRGLKPVSSAKRLIKTHLVGGNSPALELTHSKKGGYVVTGFNTNDNPDSIFFGMGVGSEVSLNVLFHTGPLDNGWNGVTNEVLLAIIHDRLVGLQGGDYPCSENDEAIVAIESALESLQRREKRNANI